MSVAVPPSEALSGQVLRHVAAPAAFPADGSGAGMAVALITTLYGAIVANVVFIPFAEKLGFLNKQELIELEIAVRGIMAIQAGENPTVIKQKLNTFLPPKVRRSLEEAA